MAVIAGYPDWYQGEEYGVPLQDITEVHVVSRFVPGGNSAEPIPMWDASAEHDWTVTAYLEGTKLTLVCDSLTEIPAQMFFKFLALEKVSGLSKVEVIGERAFCYTPKISSIDIVPENLTHIGDHAFRMSSAEDAVDLSSVPLSVVGDMATRHKRWNAEKLAAIHGVEFPRTICLDVPNSEQQTNYPNVPYGTKDGTEYTVATGGCNGLSCYHIWNAINAGTDAGAYKEYSNFLDWYNSTLNRNGDWAEKYNFTLKQLTDALGWTLPNQYSILANDGVTALNVILAKLNNGLPVLVQMWSVNEIGSQHNVCVVGCDAGTRKLAVMDSSVVGTAGVLSWLDFEDIFNGGNDNDKVYAIGYNVPVLASGNTWYTQGGTKVDKTTITQINIKDQYDPEEGNVTAEWDASAEKDGCLTAYIEGTTLTLAGNGHGCIYGHPDSSYLFSGKTTSDFFDNVTRIEGAELLNTRDVVTIEGILSGCKALTFIKYEDWDMANCEAMNSAFQFLCSYEKLDFSKWTAPKVKTLRMAFQGNSKIGTPALVSIKGLGGIGTNGITDVSGMCNGCSNLLEIDIANLHVSIADGETEKEQNTFKGCSKLKHLDFSNWNNKNAGNSTDMLASTQLEKITLGADFRFKGYTLPEPSAPYADGNWYDFEYNGYAPAEIPTGEARAYYASKFLAADDDDTLVFVRNGTLRKTAVAIRHKNGKTNTMLPSEFADQVLEL